MTIVAHAHRFVIGVDAHARNHAVAVLACPTGEVVDEAQFPATVAGLQRAVSWVARRTGGDLDVLWVIEGVEPRCPPGPRRQRHRVCGRRGGPDERPRQPRSWQVRSVGRPPHRPVRAGRRRGDARVGPAPTTVSDAVRVLIASRDHLSAERTSAVNALTALLRVADLRIDAELSRPLRSPRWPPGVPETKTSQPLWLAERP